MTSAMRPRGPTLRGYEIPVAGRAEGRAARGRRQRGTALSRPGPDWYGHGRAWWRRDRLERRLLRQMRRAMRDRAPGATLTVRRCSSNAAIGADAIVSRSKRPHLGRPWQTRLRASWGAGPTTPSGPRAAHRPGATAGLQLRDNVMLADPQQSAARVACGSRGSGICRSWPGARSLPLHEKGDPGNLRCAPPSESRRATAPGRISNHRSTPSTARALRVQSMP